MRNIYSAIVYVASAFMPLLALFNGKTKRWVEGRRNWREEMTKWRSEYPGELLWFHCASLGEFEQGRPVIERIRREFPHYRLLLTFFSPSGYEIRKNYPFADKVFYLPADLPSSMQRLVRQMKPSAFFLVKYEFWLNLLHVLQTI